MILIPLDRARVMPWKNGGGVTREIAASPDGGDFDWRLSIATVASGGPFSAFPGIDRTLTVLTGEGIVLDVAGEERLLRPFDPFAFPGDVPVSARLPGGEITDFNVMTRRGRIGHRVERRGAGAMTGGAVLALAPMVVAGQEIARFGTLLLEPGEVVTAPEGADCLHVSWEAVE